MGGLAILTYLSWADALAVAVFGAAWAGIGWRIEHPSKSHPSVSVLMNAYRRGWMEQMLERTNRIFDSQILGTLRQGTSFFASTSVIAIGGAIALIGNADRVSGVASELGAEVPIAVWQVRLALPTVMLVAAFLAFVWANRLFGYTAVVMGSVPNDPSEARGRVLAIKAAQLNSRAAANFNRGLRAMYFALAALAWLAGPVALLLATATTLWLLWSREFASRPHAILRHDVMSYPLPDDGANG